MGNLNSVPVVSQTKSLVQACAGDMRGARMTQVQFSMGCPVVSQVRSAVEAGVYHDTAAAERTQLEFLHGASTFAEGLPVVGHAKGAALYATGNTEGGDRCMKAASRTTGVAVGGILGMLGSGPVGAVAGGIAGGQAVDGMTTGIDSAVHHEFRPNGILWQGIPELIQARNRGGNSEVVGLAFDMPAAIALDGVAGLLAAEPMARGVRGAAATEGAMVARGVRAGTASSACGATHSTVATDMTPWKPGQGAQHGLWWAQHRGRLADLYSELAAQTPPPAAQRQTSAERLELAETRRLLQDYMHAEHLHIAMRWKQSHPGQEDDYPQFILDCFPENGAVEEDGSVTLDPRVASGAFKDIFDQAAAATPPRRHWPPPMARTGSVTDRQSNQEPVVPTLAAADFFVDNDGDHEDTNLPAVTRQDAPAFPSPPSSLPVPLTGHLPAVSDSAAESPLAPAPHTTVVKVSVECRGQDVGELHFPMDGVEGLDFESFAQEVHNLCGDKLETQGSAAEMRMQYWDDEGDLVTVCSNPELEEAFSSGVQYHGAPHEIALRAHQPMLRIVVNSKATQ